MTTGVTAIPATNDPTQPGIKPGWKIMRRKMIDLVIRNMKRRLNKKEK